MDTELSRGFVEFVNTSPSATLFTLEGVSQNPSPTAVSQLWVQPVLQVVDIQRFSSRTKITMFYLALSDGEALIWGVVVPKSPMEARVADFTVEIGSTVSLIRYVVTQAANGRRVVAVTEGAASIMKSAMRGNPIFDPALFELSPYALSRRFAAVPSDVTECSLGELWERFEDFEGRQWSVTVRMCWKGKLRRITAATSEGHGRFFFDATVVDRNGDGASALFAGSKPHFDIVSAGDILSLANCSLRFESSERIPAAIQIDDRSLVEKITDSNANSHFPMRPLRFLGACVAGKFVDVSEALNAEIGSTVSMKATVVNCGPAIPTVTKRGRVERRSLALQDLQDPSVTTEMTLWAEAASASPSPGTVWLFRDVAVRMFGASKQFCSRGSSEIFPQIPPAAVSNAAPAVLPTALMPSRLPFALSISEVKDSQSVLVRIVTIRQPLLYVACSSCGRKMEVVGCQQCGNTSCEKRFILHVLLSDGIGALWATGFTAASEALFQMSTAEFVARSSQDQHFVSSALRSLVGLPVFVRISKGEVDARIIELSQVAFCTLSRQFAEEIEFLVQ